MGDAEHHEDGSPPAGPAVTARSVAAWAAVGATTMLWGGLSVASSVVDGTGRFQDWCMMRWSRWCLASAGIRVRTTGLGNISRDGPQILFSNHASLSDICILGAVLPVSYRWLARKEIFRVPFIGWHLSRSGHLKIDRGDRESAKRMFAEAVERVRAGTNVLVFPEGTRSRDGALGPFKKGVFHFAIDAGVPAVPMRVFGSFGVLPKGSRTLRPATVTVAAGPPIETAGLVHDDLPQFMERMRAAMLALAP